MRPDSLPRLWRYINLLLTYLLTYVTVTRRSLDQRRDATVYVRYFAVPHDENKLLSVTYSQSSQKSAMNVSLILANANNKND